MTILKNSCITVNVASFLSFKEYAKVTSVSRKFYSELRDAVGARGCLHFLKLQVVDKQPLYTVNFKQPGANLQLTKVQDLSL